MMDDFASKMCDVQGRLFRAASEEGLDCERFIGAFMRSRLAAWYDSRYNQMQWMGDRYLMEELSEEMGDGYLRKGTVYDADTMYWIGHTYRSWNIATGESSRSILRIAGAKAMRNSFGSLHVLSAEDAVRELKGSADRAIGGEGKI